MGCRSPFFVPCTPFMFPGLPGSIGSCCQWGPAHGSPRQEQDAGQEEQEPHGSSGHWCFTCLQPPSCTVPPAAPQPCRQQRQPEDSSILPDVHLGGRKDAILFFSVMKQPLIPNSSAENHPMLYLAVENLWLSLLQCIYMVSVKKSTMQ